MRGTFCKSGHQEESGSVYNEFTRDTHLGILENRLEIH